MRNQLAVGFILAGLLPVGASSEPEEEVLQIFDQKCSSCHEDRDNGPILTGGTDLTQLRLNRDFVVAGDPENSLLHQLVTLPDDDDDRMPRSTKRKPLPPLTAKEKAVLRGWIGGERATPAPSRPFVTNAMTLAWMNQDLRALGNSGGNGSIRYLTLANLFNRRDVEGRPVFGEGLMRTFRFGVSKLLNSLSWEKTIVPPTVVDPHGTLLRFDLKDYGIHPRVWSRAFSGYSYHIQTTDPSQSEIHKTFGTFPLMRADFFVFVLSQPPLYYEALRLPGTRNQPMADAELERMVGIRYDEAIADERAVRAGFQVSAVSHGNRVIERLPLASGAGYLWKSYDFDRNRQNDKGGDLFRAPLGPGSADLTDDPNLKFSHDGGEIIFSLPNGLQGYFLTDNRGARLDEGPTAVVSDASRGDGRIINGVSCISCHSGGMISSGVKDEVLENSKNLKLSDRDSDVLERLYNQERLEKWLTDDSARFASALSKCEGGDSAVEAEPVRLLYNLFLAPLLPQDLHGEFGMEIEDLEKRIGKSEDASVNFIISKFQARPPVPVPRTDFEKEFPKLVEILSIGKAPKIDQLGLTEYGGLRDPNKKVSGEDDGISVVGREEIIKPVRLPPYDAGNDLWKWDEQPNRPPPISPRKKDDGVIVLPPFDSKGTLWKWEKGNAPPNSTPTSPKSKKEPNDSN